MLGHQLNSLKFSQSTPISRDIGTLGIEVEINISAKGDMDVKKIKKAPFSSKDAFSVGIDFSITTSSKRTSQKGLTDLCASDLR